MLTALYYALMLLVGYVWYRYGQKLLNQGLRDENDEFTKPPLGKVCTNHLEVSYARP